MYACKNYLITTVTPQQQIVIQLEFISNTYMKSKLHISRHICFRPKLKDYRIVYLVNETVIYEGCNSAALKSPPPLIMTLILKILIGNSKPSKLAISFSSSSFNTKSESVDRFRCVLENTVGYIFPMVISSESRVTYNLRRVTYA